ncbi:MAG: glucosidase [Planctomycetes bacterium]|nr:glucosidase [Planctomycetota bacterium]
MATNPLSATAEAARLADPAPWRQWGPYLSDRSWGTVREDDSADGNAWRHFTHDQARSRAYRWGEDGIAGISDKDQFLNFALALWNGKDPILKERFFGLDNGEGNHGEDAKEYWFHDDATPSHSLLRMTYKYPQASFPYDELVRRNREAGRGNPEYELVDTGVFGDGRYFDVEVVYAKAGPEDIAVRITVSNRGPEAAVLHLLPTLWFRNTWSWGAERTETQARPRLSAQPGAATIAAEHERLGSWLLECGRGPEGDPQLLFTENETNTERVFGQPNSGLFVKDGFNRLLIDGVASAVNPRLEGTKAAAHYRFSVAAGGSAVVELRLRRAEGRGGVAGVKNVIADREREADEFYAALQPAQASDEEKRIQRRAWAAMIWSKQWFSYNVPAWQRQSSPQAAKGAHFRNANWHHFDAADIISMPDKWEYPWFAAWDLAFHTIALAYVDPDFAKEQLLLMVSERYQHPNGAVSAYEWNFDDVNPPVLARAAWRVYHIERLKWGRSDRAFLEIMFQKLSLNFAWWVNRKDASGNNLFGGGFLGLDNIGVFDRSSPLPTGGHLEQADGTAWMGTFACDMAAIAQELEKENPIYRKLGVKYKLHFGYVARAMHDLAGTGTDLWDDKDGFYYDLLRLPDRTVRLQIRSMVGLIPLFASFLVPQEATDPETAAWFERFVKTRPGLARILEASRKVGPSGMRMLGLVDPDRLALLLRRMLDPKEFLSDYGIRALSKAHAEQPYTFMVGMHGYTVSYLPGESDNGMFGGNSNWRGPIWMPVNYFLVTALRRYHRWLGDAYTVEYPVGSGRKANLDQIADDISRRLVAIFAAGPDGRRPCNGGVDLFDRDPHWRDHIPFYEYFHGDSGRGVGASHQTGWTGLVAALIQELHEDDPVPVSQ